MLSLLVIHAFRHFFSYFPPQLISFTNISCYTHLRPTMICWYRQNVDGILAAHFRFLYRNNGIHMWRGNAISQRPFVIAYNRQAFFVPQLHCTAGTKTRIFQLAIKQTPTAGTQL